MLLLRTDSLPDGEQWLYELKLDGYRAIAFKRDGIVHLRSRNDNDFSGRYPGVVKGLAKMPDHTSLMARSSRSTMTGVPHSTLSRTMVQRQLRSSTTCSM
jgi:ATP dependent DNA ligase domain